MRAAMTKTYLLIDLQNRKSVKSLARHGAKK